jgi:hypothetical protein
VDCYGQAGTSLSSNPFLSGTSGDNPAMRLFFLLILVSLGLLACSAGPDKTSYILPATAGGRMCAHQCSEAQDYCHQTCDLKLRQCATDVQAQAIRDYDNYTRQQFFSHQPIELTPSDFEHEAPCEALHKSCDEDCERPYRRCYQDCGGTVDVTNSCQFLCF